MDIVVQRAQFESIKKAAASASALAAARRARYRQWPPRERIAEAVQNLNYESLSTNRAERPGLTATK
jgi:hypothetical protein